MIKESEFSGRLHEVRSRIRSACRAVGREPDSVALLPVTKTHPASAVSYALRAGLSAVGENRVQEASEKRAQLGSRQPRWELIGHLQSNKARQAVECFDRIQSVDSLKLLRRLDRCAGEAGQRLSILLQCNTGEDPNKYGFPVSEMGAAVRASMEAAHLRLEGLMTIAPLDEDPAVVRAAFERLRELRDELTANFRIELPELSMGMTGDLEAAIAAGSTQIRVGTALYGDR
jgi:pyridoxal phosphate enzyme (YggS family)